ncbi:hypothetical protein TIFTF001_019178 [Ficus carica]|uniref:Uncharacterized protein n=1 Tax=Ficus carica TaxID=3494 RepID=A0AA88DJC9_FICCA|nr:hypothetical protein TIFTF001_019178 [Ficus carica]
MGVVGVGMKKGVAVWELPRLVRRRRTPFRLGDPLPTDNCLQPAHDPPANRAVRTQLVVTICVVGLPRGEMGVCWGWG